MIKYITIFLFTLCSLTTYANKNDSLQLYWLYGSVKNEYNTPIDGATVHVEGTYLGTTTAANGQFKLAVKTAEEVVQICISAIGYKKIIVEICFKRPLENLDITLEPEGDKIVENYLEF